MFLRAPPARNNDQHAAKRNQRTRPVIKSQFHAIHNAQPHQRRARHKRHHKPRKHAPLAAGCNVNNWGQTAPVKSPPEAKIQPDTGVSF